MLESRSRDLLAGAADIVAALVTKNPVSSDQLPALIAVIYTALARLDTQQEPCAAPRQPAVPVRASVQRDHLVCLEDGAKMKMLTRYLRSRYGLTPDEYRAKWQLPADYPMVAPAYAAKRREIARKAALARPRPVEFPEESAPPPALPSSEQPAPVVARRRILTPVFKTSRVDAIESAAAEAPQRPVVSLNPAGGSREKIGSDEPGDAEARARALLCRSISERNCVSAIYNKRLVTLAPHLLFTRHEEPYLRAVTLDQDGQRPREFRLGTFKLAGLRGLAPLARSFVPHPDFIAQDHANEETTLCALAG